jgi:aspartate aminotransferase-like enzyme
LWPFGTIGKRFVTVMFGARYGFATGSKTGAARDGKLHYQKYAGTPPEHLMFALRRALDMLFEEGLENVFSRHRLLAEAVRRAIGRWSEGHALGFNVASEPPCRHSHGRCHECRR